MPVPSAGRASFWILMGAATVLVAATLDDLPAVVATHFGGSGLPNAWMSRRAYAGYLAAIGVGLPILAVFIVARRRELRDASWWLGCLLVGFAVGLHLLIWAAHRREPPRLSTGGFLTVLGLFVVGLTTWVRGLRRRVEPPH